MTGLEAIVSELSLIVKKKGFKKNRLTWHKVKDNITIVFTIQKSQYDKNTWFYLFGICIHAIADGSVSTINSCQIKYRVDNVTIQAETIANLLERWESMYGSLPLLRRCAVQGKLPGQYTVKALSYLTSINVSNF